MPRLVLLTEAYPFGTGECFLDLELQTLSRSFEEILLVPHMQGGAQREVLKNVRVDLGFSRSLQSSPLPRVLQALLASLREPLFYHEAATHLRPLFSANGLRRIGVHTWFGSRLREWLKHTTAHGGSFDTTIYYAYWMHLSAFGLALFKQSHPEAIAVSRAHLFDCYPETYQPAYIPYHGFKLARLDRIFAVTDDARMRLLEAGPEFAEKIMVRRLGTRPQKTLNPWHRTEPHGPLHIVTCSTVEARKRLDLLIEALALAQSRGVATTWTHIGSGEDEAAIKGQAEERLGPTTYRFLGHLAWDAIEGLYQKTPVDLFVNVSDSEGAPVSIMEAQSLGIPVMARSVGGIPELVSSENGVLLPALSTADVIAREILRFSQCPDDVLLNLRRASHASWAARSNAEENYTQFSRDLAGLIEGARRSVPR